MKSFKLYLNEKRRNPEQNIKISAYNALKPFKDDPDIFITFTSVNKVGINPHSNYNTPNGIYTYPLRELWNGFDHNKGHVVVPFVGEAPFVWVVKTNCSKFQEASKYNNSDFEADMDKIRKMYKEKKILTKLKGQVDKGFSKNWVAIKKVIPEMFNIIKVKKAPTQDNILKFDDHFDWDTDKMQNILDEHSNDPNDSVLSEIIHQFFKGEKIEMRLLNTVEDGGIGVESLRIRVFKLAVEKYINARLVDLKNAGTSPVDILIDNAVSKAKQKSAFAKFWNVTRWVATGGNPEGGGGLAFGFDLTKKREITLPAFEKGENDRKAIHTTQTFSVNVTAQKWSTLLRNLGYCGFVDKKGKGLIHPNEPIQGVFLSKDSFKVIDKFNNINPRVIYTTMKELRLSNYGIGELVISDADNTKMVFDNTVPPSEVMALIPITTKFEKQDIVELSRSYDQIQNKPFLMKIFYDNFWKIGDDTLTRFVSRMRQRWGFTSDHRTYVQIMKGIKKYNSVKSSNYFSKWIKNQ